MFLFSFGRGGGGFWHRGSREIEYIGSGFSGQAGGRPLVWEGRCPFVRSFGVVLL